MIDKKVGVLKIFTQDLVEHDEGECGYIFYQVLGNEPNETNSIGYMAFIIFDPVSAPTINGVIPFYVGTEQDVVCAEDILQESVMKKQYDDGPFVFVESDVTLNELIERRRTNNYK